MNVKQYLKMETTNRTEGALVASPCQICSKPNARKSYSCVVCKWVFLLCFKRIPVPVECSSFVIAQQKLPFLVATLTTAILLTVSTRSYSKYSIPEKGRINCAACRLKKCFNANMFREGKIILPLYFVFLPCMLGHIYCILSQHFRGNARGCG